MHRSLLRFVAVVVSVCVPTVAAQVLVPYAGPQTARIAAETARLGAEADRVDWVTLDVGALEGPRVSIALFGGETTYEATATYRRGEGDWTWTGRRGADLAVLVLRDGRMSGRVWAEGVPYQILPQGDGLHSVSRAAPAGLDAEGPDYIVPPEGGALAPTPSHEARPPAQADSTIDLLVAYTRELAEAYLDPVGQIQLGVDLTNASFEASGIPAVLSLAHAYQTLTASSANVYVDYNALIGLGDGRFDEVHALRDAFGADLVALVGAPSRTYRVCGVGTLNASAANAVSVLASNCAGGLSLAHEIGHNAGSLHDPYQNRLDGQSPRYPYGQGYVDGPGKWFTIMSYSAECVSTGSQGCELIPYWSSPDVRYDDTLAPERDGPTGTAAAHDNARLWAERLPTLTAFRERPSQPAALQLSETSLELAMRSDSSATAAVTITNAAAGDALPLSWQATARNVVLDGRPAGAACGLDETFTTNVAGSAAIATAGTSEYGQSFLAPCFGVLLAVEPQVDYRDTPGAAWDATLRLFEGEGTGGPEIATLPRSLTNPTDGVVWFYPSFELDAPLPIAEGDRFTWFLDLETPGPVRMMSWSTQFTGGKYDGGGMAYVGASPETAAVDTTRDMNFRLRFDPPASAWLRTAQSGHVMPGASVELVIEVDGASLGAGSHTFDLEFQTNDPDAPAVSLPVAVTVEQVVDTEAAASAPGIALGRPAPNPTRGVARVPFSLAEPGAVRIALVDLLGREVAVLAEGHRPAGGGQVSVPAGLPPGIYFVRLTGDRGTAVRRLVVVR